MSIRRLVKAVFFSVTTLCLVVLLGFLGTAFFLAQRADYGWSPGIGRPTFAASHPRVAIDDGHGNGSRAVFSGRYWPFARLLRADGYDVALPTGRFTPAALAGVDVLVIANASGSPKLQWFGLNVPLGEEGNRSDPAFTADEIATLRAWVEHGGNLLLIADHAPFGDAAAGLGAALGVTMHRGFTEVRGESSDPLLFASANGRLGDHPILRGDGRDPAVSRVMTFTGQSLDGPAGSTVLLRLPSTAYESIETDGKSVERPVGTAQGLAFALGKGRVVVLGEAAMLTAQVNERRPFGMNLPGNDNERFALNVMHWLSRQL